MKFIHAADPHIDSPMKGLGATDPEIVERVRPATRRAFETLVDRALAENVAFVVVAGDLFDGDWNDLATGLWTIRQFRRLEERRIPVFVALGNHDRQNKTLSNLKWPSNVKIFASDAPETFVYPDDLPTLFGPDFRIETLPNAAELERVALTGQSYRAQFCPENLAKNYPEAVPNAFNVGVLHTDASGDGAASNYAPTGLETLNEKRFDYWALGHAHARRTLQESPSWVGFSGVLQGRDVRETEPKGFYVVEIDGGKLAGAPRFVPADSLRWFVLDLDVSTATSLDDVKTAFLDAARRIVAESENRFCAVRVVLRGRTSLYRELSKLRAASRLDGTAREWASDLCDSLWLEEIKLEAKPPRAETDATTGLLGELSAEFARKIAEYDARISPESSAETRPEEGRADADSTAGANANAESDAIRLTSTRETLFDADGGEESEDARLLADLRKKVGPYLAELGIDFDDPATLRRWNEEARELLLDSLISGGD